MLVLKQTDVDRTKKSYYGQLGLYLLSAAGNFDCRITLDKEGPIHDFAWSPSSKEFVESYVAVRCMAEYDFRPHNLFIVVPARVMLFDQRVRTLHDFGTVFNNSIEFNPVTTGPP